MIPENRWMKKRWKAMTANTAHEMTPDERWMEKRRYFTQAPAPIKPTKKDLPIMRTTFLNNLVFYGFAVNMGIYAAIGYYLHKYLVDGMATELWVIGGAVFGIVLWLSAMLIRGITALVVLLERKAREAAV